ncbi:MAG: hypothetical protein EA405_03715 [Rhodospirillales bacterium]|nr:MAG: hypothetical protein EA405_03715 [Rhodospirillales bacterium]
MPEGRGDGRGGTGLPEIPFFDLGDEGPVALIEMAATYLGQVVAEARKHYGGLTLRLGDRATAQWLTRNGNPYRQEIAAIAARIPVPGAFLLNLSYEWSCTSAAGRDPAGSGLRLLRTLDWPLDGIGRTVVVARHDTALGPYLNVTWPGYVGVLTAMATGRFAAAINQPPARRISGSCWFDWAIHRTGVWRRSALPPAHLLRQVFEQCATYDEAKAVLTETPLCIPAFFTLAGADGQGVVIERQEHRAAVHAAPFSISNHWLGFPMGGFHDRGTDTVGRRAAMDDVRDVATNDMSWVTPPILNRKTRVSVIANAKRGSLLVQGWERQAPVTAVFNLQERLGGDTARTKPAPALAAPA